MWYPVISWLNTGKMHIEKTIQLFLTVLIQNLKPWSHFQNGHCCQWTLFPYGELVFNIWAWLFLTSFSLCFCLFQDNCLWRALRMILEAYLLAIELYKLHYYIVYSLHWSKCIEIWPCKVCVPVFYVQVYLNHHYSIG